MTSNTLLSKIKTKIIIALIIVGLLFASLFLFTACKNNDETTKIPSYSYSDTDDGLISNPNFDLNTSGIKLENFPQTSPSGWTRSKDDNANSSSAKSGVIDLTEEGWKAMLNSIYSDQYFLQYLEEKLGFSKSSIEIDLKDKNSSITESEIKAEVVKQYSEKLTAPKLKDGAKDNKVFMLNNYSTKMGIGSSQKITSSSQIAIKKGEYVKITVDVLTQNIATTDLENNSVNLGLAGANNDFGASIRLTSSLQGNSQAEYAITNINTNGEWKTYTVYAKGDAEFDSQVTLALGLGYSDLYPTEGTVYFDNITVEELETATALPTATTLNYGEKTAQTVNAGSNDTFFYDMTLSIDETYFKPISPTINGDFTEGFSGADKGWNSIGSFAENMTITVKDASYSLTITSDDFKVEREQYAFISFKLNNNLSKLASTSITVDVYEGAEKKPAVVSITETGETTVGIMIKNNFDKDDTLFDAQNERAFSLVLVVGPTKISTSEKLSDYATGTVEISEFKIAKGATYQYKEDANGDATEEETDNYKFYQLFTNITTGSTSLFAGYDSDFTATTEETTASTGFGVASTYNEYINKQPVAPSEYDGISFDHVYLKGDSQNSNVNDRTNGNDQTANVAGVIDSQYIDKYNNTNLSEIKNFFNESDKIRPLMIYNKDADSYGFINNQGAQVIEANSYAKVEVKVKVVGENAKAYIYLVDTTTKEIMTFDSFTPNSNGTSAISGTETTAEEFKFVVGDTNGEWVDVVFYIATGKTEKSFRVELWNGSRTGEEKSTGYVFFNSVYTHLTGGFTEPTSFKDTFYNNTSSPLANKENEFSGDNGSYLCYSRPLTETEKKFNAEYTDKAISYPHKIVWAKNADTIYAILNTLDLEAVNPYDTIEEDTTEEEGSGCAAETDPSTFWLSFSSILLVVVLILAIIALFIKRLRHKKKASDAKSHYTVKSRVRSVPKAKKDIPSKVEKTDDIAENSDEEEIMSEEVVEEANEPEEEITETEGENKERTLDDYVYGDVQDFGETTDNSEDKNNI